MSRSGSDTPHKKRRSEAFFGRRKSKMLSPRAANRFENLFPRLLLDPTTPAPSDISDVFPDKPASVILEIGFGGGEHLIHQARLNPQIAYIGVEPFVNSMAKALRAIEDHAIGNIRLFNDDAVEILDWLPSSSIDRIDLLYPDPWPKSRHWKRRFVNTKNLDRFARVLRPKARFHFASDISTYINWTLQHCDNHPDFTWLAEHPDDWRMPFENWTQTRYEAKAIREGRTPCYLRFER